MAQIVITPELEKSLHSHFGADLLLDDDRVGQVVRTREQIKPMFISPGHKVDVVTASELALQCCTRYRMPEPTRLAHHLTTEVRIAG